MSKSQKSLPAPGDVFISYRRCNAELVKPIEEELKRRGITYFVDWKDIDCGEDYPRIILKAISACKVLLLVWTEDVQDSEDIASEVGIAKGMNKKIYPYRIGNFNIYASSLIYPLVNKSRYEVSNQTPETIKELVNRIEVQLKGNVIQPTPEPLEKTQPPQPDETGDLSIPGTRVGERKTIVIKDVELAFRWCPPGVFMMGEEDEQHRTKITKGFWIMETQVTQSQWKAVMGKNPSHFKGDNNPVENVSWKDCNKFCKKCAQLGLPVQLPTEAQWEYACRAGSSGDYAGDLDEMGWYDWNSDSKTHPVGQKMPNAWGLYDMHGNVCEWCQDRYKSDYEERVIRGGCYCSSSSWCTSETRWYYVPDKQTDDTGFRCVVIPKDNSEN